LEAARASTFEPATRNRAPVESEAVANYRSSFAESLRGRAALPGLHPVDLEGVLRGVLEAVAFLGRLPFQPLMFDSLVRRRNCGALEPGHFASVQATLPSNVKR
jgi:hypothetical protein